MGVRITFDRKVGVKTRCPQIKLGPHCSLLSYLPIAGVHI